MTLSMLLGLWLLAFGLAAWTIRWLLNPDNRLHILDHPNHRSLHRQPVPRTGGVAILTGLAGAGAVLGAVVWPWPMALWGLLLGTLAIAGVSLWDDYRPLPWRVRLMVHLLAALVVVAGFTPGVLVLPGLDIRPPLWLAAPLTLLGVAWLVNLYNFMDGLDGLAGGMAVVGFGSLALAGDRAGDEAFAATTGLVAAASAGFLVWNWPPARIFMGDVGSSSLGYLAAAACLAADQRGLLPLWAGLLIFSPFVVDATVTLLQRLHRREPLSEAHRSHHYQRLAMHWGHRKTLGAALLLMLACAGSALAATHLAPAGQRTVLLGWAGAYALMAWRIRLITTQQLTTTYEP